jgi:hypothetical protein
MRQSAPAALAALIAIALGACTAELPTHAAVGEAVMGGGMGFGSGNGLPVGPEDEAVATDGGGIGYGSGNGVPTDPDDGTVAGDETTDGGDSGETERGGGMGAGSGN